MHHQRWHTQIDIDMRPLSERYNNYVAKAVPTNNTSTTYVPIKD